MKPQNKQKLKQWLKKKISFRFHMFLVMLSTIFLGISSNFVMYRILGLDHPALRYPLAVIISYGWFLLFIRYYIKIILYDLQQDDSNSSDLIDVVDVLDIPVPMTEEVLVAEPIYLPNRGGEFSGGGASGKWGESSDSGILSAVDVDEGVIVVVIVGAILAAVVFTSGTYLIWHSPEILSECLLQVILVTGIKRRMNRFSESEWLAHILKTTVLPFIVVLVVSIIFGGVLKDKCPEANSVKEFKETCWVRKAV